jgi:hypothetical protein
MSTCPELVHKVALYKDACGLKDADKLLYLRDIAEELCRDYEIEEIDLVFLLFRPTSCWELRKLKKFPDIRKNVIQEIVKKIKHHEIVTEKFVKQLILKSTPGYVETPHVNVGKVNRTVMLKQFPVIENNLTSKINALKSILTPGQIGILNQIMIKYDLDDEIAALSKALILVKEGL